MSKNLWILGMGKMGTALLTGLQKKSPFAGKIHICDLHPEKLQTHKSSGVEMTAWQDLPQILPAAKMDYLFLCVKPQDLTNLAKTLQMAVKPETVIVSILAGVTMADISQAFAGHSGIVRAMPNIAALVGEAATGLSHDGHLSENQVQEIHAIFASMGTCHWVKEELLDAITGLSGSGPAYIYMVIEALADGGVKMGIPRRMAHELSVQTLLGAAKLVQQSNQHPAVLREEVTTPGGTTIHAIQDLEERGLRAMLMSAVEKATLRAAKLRSPSS